MKPVSLHFFKYFIFSFAVITWVPSIASKPFETLEWETTKGIPVVFYQAMDVPMLDINIAFRAGSAYDSKRFGISALTTRLLNQGTTTLSSSKLAEKLGETGAQFEAQNNQDMVVLHLKTLTNHDYLNQASSLFASIINHPVFPLDAFITEKSQQLLALSLTKENPDKLATEMFFQMLYKNHPYAHPILGTKESLKQLKVNDVRDFYKTYFVSQNALIVLVGAITETEAHALAEQITKDLPQGKKAPPVPDASPLQSELNIEVKFPSTQSIIRLGQLGITHQHPHYFPLLVGNYILGGGTLVSKLSNELREKRGLTYGVTSQFLPLLGTGPFIISLSTKNAEAGHAISITQQTLNHFIQNGPTDDELNAAKKYLIGSYPLSFSSNQNIANILLRIAFYKLPRHYLQDYVGHVDEVTKESIKSAFQSLIIPDKLLQITVGKVN